MKKIISLLAVLMLCTALLVPAFATNEFKPSVEIKPAPEIVTFLDPDGNEALAMLVDDEGNILAYIYASDRCLVVTPVSRANEQTGIPEEAKNALLDVYNKLSNGSMTLPYELFNAGLVSSNMVIRDLFDVTLLCSEHSTLLEKPNVRLVITFRLGVEEDKAVYSMTFNQEWAPIVSTANNGDGTITCVFEHLCPVAFSVANEQTPPPQSGDPAGDQMDLWFIIGGAAMLAVIVLTAFYVINSKKYNK